MAMSRRSLGTACLAIGQTLVWAGLYYVFAAFLVAFEAGLGWGRADLALGLTVAVLAAGVAAPLAGRFVDAGRGPLMLGISPLIGAAALALLSVTDAYAPFLALWVVVGLAQGGSLYEACFAFLTATLGREARPVIVRITLVAGFAGTLAFPAGAYLADHYGWQVALRLFAATVALVGAPLLYVGARLAGEGAEAHVTAAPSGSRSALQTAVRDARFWLIGFAYAALGSAHAMVLAHIMPLLLERGLVQAAAVTAASLIGPAQVLGRILMMTAERRISPMRMAAWPFAGMVVSLGLLYGAGAAIGAIVAFAVIQGACSGVTSILKPFVIAESFGSRGYGVISGWLALPYMFGAALSPYLGALLWQAGGYGLALEAAIAMVAAGFVAMLAVLKIGRRRTVY
jgi:MFS family permease